MARRHLPVPVAVELAGGNRLSKTPMEKEMFGTIKSVAEGGFGFIRRGDGQGDIFFHATGLVYDLEFGETLRERRVEFDVVDYQGRPRAVRVRTAS